ncbi:hypothetical protein ES706_04334 [subsurface metagenome]
MYITSAMIGIGILALGFSVMVQSHILRNPANKRPFLGRKLRQLSLLFFVTGGVLFAIGANIPQLFNPYIPIGVMLIMLGVNHQVQGLTLIIPKANLSDLGKQIRPLALSCIIGGVIAVSVAVGRIIHSAGLANIVLQFLLN